MSAYIAYTDEQKRRANEVDLEEFLRRRGERLLSSGRDKRLASDRSVTIRGCEWYDHAIKQGGRAIDFLQIHEHMSFQEAMDTLLCGEQGQAFPQAKAQPPAPPRAFALPDAGPTMRRVYAYLTKQRRIHREVITAFAQAGLLYEDAKYHNAVFVGFDEHGAARHAHKRSTNSNGKAFRQNVEGSDPRHSFHWLGGDGSLYVFEAPIDLLSYITLYQNGWERHNYVACCGVSTIPVIGLLCRMEQPRQVFLCLDNDAAGQAANLRMAEQIQSQFGITADILIPAAKDWNEELCAAYKAQEPVLSMGRG